MSERTSLDEQVEMLLPARPDIRSVLLRQIKEDTKQTYTRYLRPPLELIASPFITTTIVRRWSNRIDMDYGATVRAGFYSLFMAEIGLVTATLLAQTDAYVLAPVPLITNALSIGYEISKMTYEYVHDRIAMLREQQNILQRETLRDALTSDNYAPLDPAAEQALHTFETDTRIV
jgi:hypothetical protein